MQELSDDALERLCDYLDTREQLALTAVERQLSERLRHCTVPLQLVDASLPTEERWSLFRQHFRKAFAGVSSVLLQRVDVDGSTLNDFVASAPDHCAVHLQEVRFAGGDELLRTLNNKPFDTLMLSRCHRLFRAPIHSVLSTEKIRGIFLEHETGIEKILGKFGGDFAVFVNCSGDSRGSLGDAAVGTVVLVNCRFADDPVDAEAAEMRHTRNMRDLSAAVQRDLTAAREAPVEQQWRHEDGMIEMRTRRTPPRLQDLLDMHACACSVSAELGKQVARALAIGRHGNHTFLHATALAYGTPCMETVRTLLKWGADVNATSVDAATSPLFAACKRGHTELVELLLRHGARVTWRNKRHETALSIAALHGYFDVVKAMCAHIKQQRNRQQIIQSLDETRRGAFQWPPVLAACANTGPDALGILRCLLRHGHSPRKSNRLGLSPLHVCAHGYKLEHLKVLLEYVDTVDLTDQWDRTPLEIASALARGKEPPAKGARYYKGGRRKKQRLRRLTPQQQTPQQRQTAQQIERLLHEALLRSQSQSA